MSLIDSSLVFPNDVLTRQALFGRFLREYDIGETGTVTTGGSTYQLLDTSNLLSAQYSKRKYRGAWVRIVAAAGVGANLRQGEVRPVIDYDPDLGRVEVSPPFDDALVAGDSYEIWRRVNPSKVISILDDIVAREVKVPRWAWLSSMDTNRENVPDGTGPVGLGGSAVFVTGPDALSEFGQEGYISFTDTTQDGTAMVGIGTGRRLQPGLSYHFSVEMNWSDFTDGATLQLEVWDDSFATKYIESQPFAAPYFGRMWLEFTAPNVTTPVHMVVRCTATGKNASIQLANPVFYEIGAKRLPAPTGLYTHSDLKGCFELQWEDVGGGFLRHGFTGEPKNDLDLQPTSRGYWIVNRRGFRRPTYCYVHVAPTAITSDVVEYPWNSDKIIHTLAERTFAMLNVQFEGRFVQQEQAAHGKLVRENIRESERLGDVVRTPSKYEWSAGFEDSFLGDL